MRLTTFINRRVVQSVFHAFDFAERQGVPLNTYVVIKLRERDDAAASRLFDEVRRKFRRWLSYIEKKGGPSVDPIYVSVFENPNGSVHVNWAVHVPPALEKEFRAKLMTWVEKVQGLMPSDLHVQPIKLPFAKRLAKYIVKGVDPSYIEHFYLTEMAAPQGLIAGRRACVSPSIGRKARSQAGFRNSKGRYRQYGPVIAAQAV